MGVFSWTTNILRIYFNPSLELKSSPTSSSLGLPGGTGPGGYGPGGYGPGGYGPGAGFGPGGGYGAGPGAGYGTGLGSNFNFVKDPICQTQPKLNPNLLESLN